MQDYFFVKNHCLHYFQHTTSTLLHIDKGFSFNMLRQTQQYIKTSSGISSFAHTIIKIAKPFYDAIRIGYMTQL